MVQVLYAFTQMERGIQSIDLTEEVPYANGQVRIHMTCLFLLILSVQYFVHFCLIKGKKDNFS